MNQETKLFALYAINAADGTRDFLWLKRLPVDFDWQAWGESRREAMRVLNIRQFIYEEIPTQ